MGDQADVRGARTAEEDYSDDEADGDQGEEHEAFAENEGVMSASG